MSETETSTEANRPTIGEELSRFWRGMPDKPLFLVLLGAWLVFFHLLGNSTFGYVDTPSLYGWMNYAYGSSKDDELGYIIPLIVLGLYYWKRDELLAAPKRNWWPALALVVCALAVHLLGYVIQQTRISIVGFYFGVYALTGLVWGPAWLRASFFPFFLFAFAVPLGTMADFVTVPLRHLVSDITGWICGTLLGVDIIQEGVFVAFRTRWKTAVIILSAFPLAVTGNVFRLALIILAAEVAESAQPGAGQAAGNFVHSNGFLSLLPYVPAFVGVLILGRVIKEDERPEPATEVAGE